MSDHDFVFALRLSEGARFDDMIRDVTTRILGFVGCPGGDAAALTDQLLGGLARCHAERVACHVQFRARAGEIEIILAAGDRRISCVSRRLP